MDMMDSMTMPQVVIAAIVVLAVVGVGLYLFVRVAGQRQVQRDDQRDDEPRKHRRGGQRPDGDPSTRQR